MEDNTFKKSILQISLYLWEEIKEKFLRIRNGNTRVIYPLFMIKEIDNISSISCRILINIENRKKKFINGRFYVVSNSCPDYNFNYDNQLNSFSIYKSVYFIHNFHDSKITIEDLNINDLELCQRFQDFNQSILYLFNNVIRNLKFDIYYGNFIYGDLKINNFNDSLTSILKSFENIKTIGEACCVCNEETAIVTDCSHPLCIGCYIKIRNSDSLNQQCPLCRAEL